MGKRNLHIVIENNSEKTQYETIGIVTNRFIKYKEKDGTMVMYNLIDNSLARENKDIKMNYVFSLEYLTQGTILIKAMNKELKLEIQTSLLRRNQNNLNIEYTIENEKFIYRIEEVKWVY